MPKGRKKKSRREAEPAKPKSFDFKPFAGVELDIPDPETTKDNLEDRPSGREPAAGKPSEPGNDDIMAEMMDGVVPLDMGKPLAGQKSTVQPMKAEMDDSELVMRQLDELVHGNAPFELADTDEFIEASVRGFDRRVLKKLRRGEFSIQGHIDLHGLRREEARLAVAEFVERSQTEGKRCVLIVHGRGHGSKDNIPVLKEKLTAWLTRGVIGKRVLAFTSARQWDGGTGAVYVLLRD